jgi:histidine triad (HIT) family protein
MVAKSDPNCLFCKIAAGEIPSDTVYRDEFVVAIVDVNPQAPVHLLVLPIEHYPDLGATIAAGRADVANALVRAATALGTERGGPAGFRLVVNTGAEGGQTVAHAHVHVLAGRSMHWPPG